MCPVQRNRQSPALTHSTSLFRLFHRRLSFIFTTYRLLWRISVPKSEFISLLRGSLSPSLRLSLSLPSSFKPDPNAVKPMFTMTRPPFSVSVIPTPTSLNWNRLRLSALPASTLSPSSQNDGVVRPHSAQISTVIPCQLVTYHPISQGCMTSSNRTVLRQWHSSWCDIFPALCSTFTSPGFFI